MKVIIDIPKEEYDSYQVLRGFMCYGDRLIKNGIPIPDNATNGDVIKTMFPNHEINVHNEPLGFTNGIDFVINMTRHECLKLWFPSGWWNAPYKKEA